MGKIGIVIRQELVNAWSSRRFWLLSAASTLLIVLAVVQGSLLYSQQVSQNETLQKMAEDEWLAQDAKRPHSANHFGKWVVKPPTALSIFDRGVEDFLGQQIVLDAHVRSDMVASKAEEDPLSALIGTFDLAFVTAYLLPLLVILLVYDAVCGEKEAGTLRLTLAQPISRRSLLWGKVLGQLAVLGLAFGVPLLIGIALVPVLMGVSFGGDAVLRLIGIGGASLLYILLFLLVGIWISSSTARPAVALGGLFAVWVVMVFFIPRLSIFIAEIVHPAPSAVALNQEQNRLRKEIDEFRTARLNEVVQELRKTYPEITEDFAFARQSRNERAPTEWRVDPSGIFAAEANAKINEVRQRAVSKVREGYERQEALALRIASLSPTTSFLAASMTLAGTDPVRHRHFQHQVDGFFIELQTFFNALWAKNVQAFEAWETVPDFHYVEESREAVWGRYARAALVLAMGTLIGAIGAIRQLRRYDVR
jgi:ABC-2 type transport system permease protein